MISFVFGRARSLPDISVRWKVLRFFRLTPPATCSSYKNPVVERARGKAAVRPEQATGRQQKRPLKRKRNAIAGKQTRREATTARQEKR
jgi:hypothetical protein